MLSLEINQIKDPISRENFLKISDYVRGENLLIGRFKFYEIIFTQAETNKKIPHRLGFVPKDIIQTSLTGAGALTWNYSSFDSTNLNVTTTGACTVRAFIGNYSASGA